jgi:hypothetical protein
VFSNLLIGNDSFVGIRCNGNVISDPLLSNGHLLRLSAVMSLYHGKVMCGKLHIEGEDAF